MPFLVHSTITVDLKWSCEYHKGSLTWENDSFAEGSQENQSWSGYHIIVATVPSNVDDADTTGI